MNPNEPAIAGPDTPAVDAIDSDVAAWEEIAPGRYMPRRVRGSCKGRALG
jgi:hypothetical protein